MRVNKINRSYCGLVFEMPVLTFIKEFVSRYYKEGKFTLSQLNWIEATLENFDSVIYYDSDIFGNSKIYLMPGSYYTPANETPFSFVMDGLTKVNTFINTIDILVDIFEDEPSMDTINLFRDDCLRLEHLFGKLENYALEDIKYMVKAGEIEYI